MADHAARHGQPTRRPRDPSAYLRERGTRCRRDPTLGGGAMRGTIIKRGSSWAVVVEVGRDPSTGKRVRKWHSGYRTKRDAERARTELLSRLDHGTYVSPDRRTVGGYLEDDWLPAVKARLTPSTWDSYARNIRLHIAPELGPIPLQALTAARLNEFYASLSSNGRRDGRGGLAPKTVRYLHGIIRRALADAARWSLVQRNVADHADPPTIRSTAPEMKTWTADQLSRFLDFVSEDRLYAAWALAAATGMRRGEVLGLRWSDVDSTPRGSRSGRPWSRLHMRRSSRRRRQHAAGDQSRSMPQPSPRCALTGSSSSKNAWRGGPPTRIPASSSPARTACACIPTGSHRCSTST